jgi:uncharacterized protein (DUF2062 family)
MSEFLPSIQSKTRNLWKRSMSTGSEIVTQSLRQGISPRRLALTLALGFAIGCIPLIGIPTLACAALAFFLRLNLPAIQAANYFAMPLQILLIAPLVRVGGWLIASNNVGVLRSGSFLHATPMHALSQASSLAGQALLAWFVLAAPVVLLLTGILTIFLRRIPAIAQAERCD